MKAENKTMVSLRLSHEARQALVSHSERLGISQAAVVELLLRNRLPNPGTDSSVCP